MAEVLDSYLVALGFEVNQPQLNKFHGALNTTQEKVASSVSGILGDFLKFQVGATTALTTVGFGVIGYIDKLAMADQQTRLFAMRSFMTIQQARGVQTALSVLGASLDDVAWDRELHDRFMVLINDQKELAKYLGPSYEKQMHDVRDVVFQLQRLQVKGQALGMMFANDLLTKMGFGDGDLLSKLMKLNDFVLKNMPQWADELSTDVMPILRDFWGIMKDIGALAEELGLEFTNLVGVLSGDDQLEGSTFDFHKFAAAIQHVAHWMAVLVHYMLVAERILVRFAPLIAGIVGGGGAGGTIGSIIGGIAGIEGGPAGVLAGATAGGALGSSIGAWAGGITGGAVMTAEEINRYRLGGAQGRGAPTPADVATATLSGKGLEFDSGSLNHAVVYHVMMTESGGRQWNKKGELVTSGKGAIGLMQLMPDTAARLGVDPADPRQNMVGGIRLLQQLNKKYGGNWDNTLAAYNWGEGNVDKALANHRAFPREVQQYARGIEQASGIQVGSIVVNVPASAHSPQLLASAVKHGVAAGLKDQNNRLSTELSGSYAD